MNDRAGGRRKSLCIVAEAAVGIVSHYCVQLLSIMAPIKIVLRGKKVGKPFLYGTKDVNLNTTRDPE